MGTALILLIAFVWACPLLILVRSYNRLARQNAALARSLLRAERELRNIKEGR